VAKVTGPGSYRLQTLEGEDINNSCLHDYSGVQVYTTTPTPHRRKRPSGPGSSLRTTPLQDPARAATYGSWAATSIKDSSSGLLRDHTPRSSLRGYLRIYDPAYTATYGSTAIRGYPLQRYSAISGPPGPSDYSVTTALAIQVDSFSNKV
jgi:hypothetical protein